MLCVACTKGEVILGSELSLAGTCTKCASTVLAAACDKATTADLVIKAQTFTFYLSASDSQLVTVASGEDITEIMLLTAAEFNCDYNADMVITNVSRN